jgi:hypothetical protein
LNFSVFLKSRNLAGFSLENFLYLGAEYYDFEIKSRDPYEFCGFYGFYGSFMGVFMSFMGSYWLDHKTCPGKRFVKKFGPVFRIEISWILMAADLALQIGWVTFFCESTSFYHSFLLLRVQLRILDYAISTDISFFSTCMSNVREIHTKT